MSTEKALTSWEEKLQEEAKVAAESEESSSSGQFFSLSQGQLKWNDSPLPGNQMGVIILDAMHENVFYEGAYDANQIKGPTCFAYGRAENGITKSRDIELNMQPHASVFEAGQEQSEYCHSCPQNEFGSADIGKGKACKNQRRLAVIPAGEFQKDGSFELFDDEKHYLTAGIGYLKLPVMSVKEFSVFVQQISASLKRPPFGVVTRVYLTPDPKSQFKVKFEALEKVPDNLMETVMHRREEANALIDFPYQLGPKDEPKSKAAKQPSKKY